MTVIEQFERFYKSCCRVAMKMNGYACPICRAHLPHITKARDLREGDRIHVLSGAFQPFATAAVVKIEQDASASAPLDVKVHVARPFIHSDNTITTGGAYPYIGLEQFSLWGDTEVLLVEESHVTDVRVAETDEGRIARAGGRIARTKDGGLVRVS